jgi:hypothetical protein
LGVLEFAGWSWPWQHCGPDCKKTDLSGAMMARRVMAVLILLVLGSFALRCGSSVTTTTTTQTGSLYTLIGDSPICDVLAARFNITSLILYYSGSGAGVTLRSSVSTLIPLDLQALRGSFTVLDYSATNAGSYGRINLGLAVSSMYLYDPSANPPISNVTENLTTGSSLTYNINPPLIVPSSGISVVSLDFDLEHSLEVNSQGQITGVINPMATATAPAATTAGGVGTVQGYGDLDGVDGFVSSVSTSQTISQGITYLGAITLQLLASDVSGSGGPALATEVTKNTTICGPTTFSNQACCQSGVTSGMNPACSIPQAPLPTILTASYAWADGFVDSNGYFEDKTLFLGPQESVVDQQIALIGPILSVTTDTSGNVTGFNMFLREAEPEVTQVPLDALTTVTISSNTLYNTVTPPIYTTTSPTVAQGTNFAALPFGPDQITVGQDVVVHGVYTVPPSSTTSTTAVPVSMVANEIDLDLQTHEGNFVSLLAAQPDNRTGGFAFEPCATLDQQNSNALPIYVFTSPQTVFSNTSGLTSLQSQPTLLVKGLLFLEPQGATINGVSVPPGKEVMLAKQVIQYQ